LSHFSTFFCCCCCVFLFIWFLEIGSFITAQADLELAILLPEPPQVLGL
jgi:hypothetical protein